MENLRISKNSRANSSSPARMTANSSFQRLTPMDIALASVNSYKYCFKFLFLSLFKDLLKEQMKINNQ